MADLEYQIKKKRKSKAKLNNKNARKYTTVTKKKRVFRNQTKLQNSK